MTIVLIILVVLLVIGFFVLLWKSSSTWEWPTLVTVSLVFLLALTFVPLAGMSMKARIAWQKVRTELAERLERETAEQERIKYGGGAADEGRALMPLQVELRRLRADAGRVWRHLPLVGAGEAGVRLRVPPQEAAPAPGGAPPQGAEAGEAGAVAGQTRIPEDLIVYGFAEGRGPQDGAGVPRVYLGEFRVASAEDGQVTLSPTLPLSQAQREAIESGRATPWSLYEVMPVDAHDPFIVPGSDPDEEQLFGRVDEALVRRLLGESVSPQTLEAYLRDGARARPDDPLATRWMQVEFTQDHEIPVDSAQERSALDGGYFDLEGQAVDSRLQRGPEKGPVKFSEGQQLVIKQEWAEDLISRGVARLIDTYHVRPLNDYNFAVLNIVGRLDRLAEKKLILERETANLQKANELNVSMITARQGEKVELEKEKVQYGRERQALETFVSKLEAELTETRQELSELYRDNLTLAQQLASVQTILEQEIEQRTEAATASGQPVAAP